MVGVMLAGLAATPGRFLQGWAPAQTAMIIAGVVVLAITHNRLAGSVPRDSIMLEASSIFLIPAGVLLPPGAAPALCIAVNIWFQLTTTEARGRRRLDMALQMAPGYAVGSALAGNTHQPTAVLAVLVAAGYLITNFLAIAAFAKLYMGNSVRWVIGDGSIWMIDAAVASLGVLAASAAAANAAIVLAAVPVCWLCQYALLRPHLEAQLDLDVTSGVLSRRGITRRGIAMASAAAATGSPMAALMVDIDHFKRINDTYGHPVGDLVLAEVGRRIMATTRAGTRAGRVGGEEFVVLLPYAGRDDVLLVAERIRQAVARPDVLTGHGPVAVTVSIGCAVATPGRGSDPETHYQHLLARADVELYAAKEDGRNCVRYSPPVFDMAPRTPAEPPALPHPRVDSEPAPALRSQ